MSTAAKFDRLEGLPQADRWPYNLVVAGKGDILLRPAGHPGAGAEPRSEIARRYIEGTHLLAALAGDGAGPATSGAEKPCLVLLRSPTARSLTIVFSGNNPEFALPAHLLLNYDTHLVLIHDRRRCFALAGIPGLGADYDSSVAGLRRIIDALRPAEVFVLGISAGGAGAIKFACDLPAKRLLCFSVPTTLRLEDDRGATMARYPQLARLYRRDRSLGIDLAAYYAAHADAPPATLIYSAGHSRDAWLALRMAGMHGVTLVPTDGYTGHTTYQWLTLHKKIGGHLDRLYEADGTAAPAWSPERVARPGQGQPPEAAAPLGHQAHELQSA